MKQKLQDLALLLKSDRRAQIGLVVVMIFVVAAMFSSGPQQRVAKKKPEVKAGAGQGGREELIDDVMVAVQQDLKNIQAQSQETATRVEELSKNSANFETKTAEIFKRILEQMADNEAKKPGASGGCVVGMPGCDINGLPKDENADGIPDHLQIDANADGIPDYQQSGGTGFASGPGGPGSAVPGADGFYPAIGNASFNGGASSLELDTIGFNDTMVVPPPPPTKSKEAFVGSGDSVRLKLLAGVRAPTDGTPYPVVFKLIGDVFGPDGSALPLGEARLVAAAQGSLVDSRVLYRLSSLNIRLPSGRHQEIGVDGWVVGEDGIRGMEGVLIDPFGKAIGAAGFAGALSGFGKAVSQGQTTQSTNMFGGTQEIVTGDDGTYAAGKALGNASDTYADLIKERLKLLVPHVEVLSGREATAVFSKSFTIKGLFDELNSEDDEGMTGMH